MAKKDIQSVLQEDRVFPPSAQFRKAAALQAGDLQAMYAKAERDHVGFWADLARAEIYWQKPFTVVLDADRAPNYRWFTDGRLNVSHNCLDVNLRERGGKTAIVFEGEPGDVRKLTYAELHGEVCRFANALKDIGIGRGDRVVVYMPLIPEAVIAMQACARIGAVHSVVFGGFSSNAVKDRIEDAGAKLVITADGGWRGGHAVELKRAVDKALADVRAATVPCAPAAITGGMTRCPDRAPSASRNGWTRSIPCTCSILRVPRASPRASSIPAPDTCSTPR
jgi:acetyl-CoA synthetase